MHCTGCKLSSSLSVQRKVNIEIWKSTENVTHLYTYTDVLWYGVLNWRMCSQVKNIKQILKVFVKCASWYMIVSIATSVCSKMEEWTR